MAEDNGFTVRRLKMKVLNLILMAIILTIIGVGISYAAFVITLSDMRLENIQIYRQSVIIDPQTGATEMQMKMSMNYTLYDGSGNTKGMNTEFTLSAAQRTAVLNFTKPFVQSQATADGVNAPTWAQ